MPERERRPEPDRQRKPAPGPDEEQFDPFDDVDTIIDDQEEFEDRDENPGQ